MFAIKFNLWAIEIGFFLVEIYPLQSLAISIGYKRNLCKLSLCNSILKGKNEESWNILFSLLMFDGITWRGI